MSIFMDDDEFQLFLDSTYDELESKQKYLKDEFGLGHFDRYDLEPENELIIFTSLDGNTVKANFVPIGTFCPANGTWMWGWNNSAFTEELRRKSENLKSLADITGFKLFTDQTIDEVDEDMAWEMAAMSVNNLKSQGVYRAPANNLWYFYALFNMGA